MFLLNTYHHNDQATVANHLKVLIQSPAAVTDIPQGNLPTHTIELFIVNHKETAQEAMATEA